MKKTLSMKSVIFADSTRNLSSIRRVLPSNSSRCKHCLASNSRTKRSKSKMSRSKGKSLWEMLFKRQRTWGERLNCRNKCWSRRWIAWGIRTSCWQTKLSSLRGKESTTRRKETERMLSWDRCTLNCRRCSKLYRRLRWRSRTRLLWTSSLDLSRTSIGRWWCHSSDKCLSNLTWMLMSGTLCRCRCHRLTTLRWDESRVPHHPTPTTKTRPCLR